MKVIFCIPSLDGSVKTPAKPAKPAPRAVHNVVIFVADGLRYSSVTPDIAPTLAGVRARGVDFTNSHAVYPTVTTANASAIASGHYLGDTGDYDPFVFIAAGPRAIATMSNPDEDQAEHDAAALVASYNAAFGLNNTVTGATALRCTLNEPRQVSVELSAKF